MVVLVEDNGIGIGPDIVRGIGLKSMEERAAEVGGEIAVESRPGGGTSVFGRFPVTAVEGVE